MSLRLGIEESFIRNTFKTFKGISQRCEKKIVNSITLLDDYAHHPTELKALLETIRAAIHEKNLSSFFNHTAIAEHKLFWKSLQQLSMKVTN